MACLLLAQMAMHVIGKVTKVWNLKLQQAVMNPGKAIIDIDAANSLRSIWSKKGAFVWTKYSMTKVVMHRIAIKNTS